MYAGYGIARGKTLQEIENNHKEAEHPLEQYMDIINDRINKYKVDNPSRDSRIKKGPIPLFLFNLI